MLPLTILVILIAVSTPAFSRSIQEQQTRLTPPLRRAPPGQYTGFRQTLPEGRTLTPGFDAILDFRRLKQRTPVQLHRALLERLPGPHLTLCRAFSRIAHHDSLQLTQHRAV